jgi:hypothetical protein
LNKCILGKRSSAFISNTKLIKNQKRIAVI